MNSKYKRLKKILNEKEQEEVTIEGGGFAGGVLGSNHESDSPLGAIPKNVFSFLIV